MSKSATQYPFAPKSTRLLRRGQFWAIPLASGQFGAGCVVGMHSRAGKASQRMFIAGVVRWVGTHAPSATDIENRPLVEFAFAHLKAITESGGLVLGEARLQFAEAPATAESLSLPTWGFGVPRLLAEGLAKNGG
ncbi:MAG: hypothetical protein EKK49_01565 [Rhodocyclaceae bacterium]|nr:MAG: hypothetical protein EKK49_01565 [Rhodocyclaceae bacterium]